MRSPSDRELVARAVQALGPERGRSVDEAAQRIAHATGYSARQVYRWLSGTHRMRAGTRALLERLLAEATD